MKTLGLLIVGSVLIGITSCDNIGNNNRNDSEGADSIFGDSVANDSPTWGDTTNASDTATTTDSLASPSFP